MTADDIITALTTGQPVPNWISQAALRISPPSVPPGQVAKFYQTTAANFFTEVTVRIPAVGRTRRGKPKFQRRRMDLVALVQPHYRCWQPFVVGVEVKIAEHDLLSDNKLSDYLNYCDLFYLAVPSNLEEAALSKIEDSSSRISAPFNIPFGAIGLLLIQENRAVCINHHPSHLVGSIQVNHLNELYAELLIRPFKRAGKECKSFIEFERNLS